MRLHHNFLLLQLLILFASTQGCNLLEDSETTLHDLQDTETFELIFIDDNLYTATNDGVYRISRENFDYGWERVGLQNHFVSSIVELPDGKILAGIRNTADVEAPPLFRSDQQRNDFDPYPQDYAEDYDDYTIVYMMTQDPHRPDTIYARGSYHVARSEDAGESWELIFGDWDSMGYQADIMEVHPYETETIWVGGETAAFMPYVGYSDDLGESWQEEGSDFDVDGDNAAYSLAFHPDDPDQLLLGMEGLIKYSDDHGYNWETVFENDLYHYIHDMATVDGEPSETVYASGTENGAQGGGLFFLKTTDFGESWEKTSADNDIDGLSINELHVRDEGGSATIYFATSQGVWKYRDGDFSRIGGDE